MENEVGNVENKKDNKKTYLLIGGVLLAVFLFCMCIGTLIFIFSNKTSAEEEAKAELYMSEYIVGRLQIEEKAQDGRWEACDGTEEYNILTDGRFTKEAGANLYEPVRKNLENTRDCYVGIREEEYSWAQAHDLKTKFIDCSKVSKSEEYEQFKIELSKLLRVEKEIIDLTNKEYEAHIALNMCNIDALVNHVGNTVAKETAEAQCKANFVDYKAEIGPLESAQVRLIGITKELAYEFI